MPLQHAILTAMGCMRRLIARCVLIPLLAVVAGDAGSRGLTFGIVGKSVDDANFIAAWHGCAEEAKQAGDKCELLGSKGAADPRLQAQALEDAMTTNAYAAFAISVTASEFLARVVQKTNIPVITFDSPFNAKSAHLSRAYVGTDNIAFGRDLARVARTLRPQGGTICLMTAANDPNLAQRVWGVRRELSGNDLLPDGKHLTGEGGWTESDRCPWNAADKTERALRELEITLSSLKPDVFLSVGHWPIVDPAAYRNTVAPFRNQIAGKKPLMIIAVGNISTERAALMTDKLVHGYVSINFDQIGRNSYRIMRALVDGKPVPSQTRGVNTILTGK